MSTMPNDSARAHAHASGAMAFAQARQFLISRAAERLELSIEDLTIEDGLVRGRDNRSIS